MSLMVANVQERIPEIGLRRSLGATRGSIARVDQFVRVHLFHPSTDVYSCPLAMTDGATRTLLAHGNAALIARAVPRLTT